MSPGQKACPLYPALTGSWLNSAGDSSREEMCIAAVDAFVVLRAVGDCDFVFCDQARLGLRSVCKGIKANNIIKHVIA